MQITKDLLTKNPFSRPGTFLNSIKGIVIHWTANPATSAEQNRAYFESLKAQNEKSEKAKYASAHFIIGINGKIIQCIPITERAYHVGSLTYKPKAVASLSGYPNNCTLGIELCHPNSAGNFTEQTIKSAVELCTNLCLQNNLEPTKALFRHYDITGKNCPKYFVENENEWQKFVQEVEEKFNFAQKK